MTASAPSHNPLRNRPFQVPDGPIVNVTETNNQVKLHLTEGGVLTFAVGTENNAVVLSATGGAESISSEACWSLAYWSFLNHPDCVRLIWRNIPVPESALFDGLVLSCASGYETWQSMFWQLPGAWLCGKSAVSYPLTFALDQAGWCPVRPPKPEGTVYRRFDHRLGEWFSLRTLDIEEDLGRFNRWQNAPRVLQFWEEGGNLADHRRYLEDLAADPRALMLVGCFDEKPFAYFEVYWVKGDRIAPYYYSTEFDRGIHMLVGEEVHRGPHKVDCWLPSLVHYLFLDDCRTQTIVSEPRTDNERMIGYLRKYGFHRSRNIVFPHKEASLMMLTRQRFFEVGLYGRGRTAD